MRNGRPAKLEHLASEAAARRVLSARSPRRQCITIHAGLLRPTLRPNPRQTAGMREDDAEASRQQPDSIPCKLATEIIPPRTRLEHRRAKLRGSATGVQALILRTSLPVQAFSSPNKGEAQPPRGPSCHPQSHPYLARQVARRRAFDRPASLGREVRSWSPIPSIQHDVGWSLFECGMCAGC